MFESDLKLLRSFITSLDIFDYYGFQVVGYKGPAVVVVSCVEDKPPYRTHPHNLVGKDGMCKKGNKIRYVHGWRCGINPFQVSLLMFLRRKLNCGYRKG